MKPREGQNRCATAAHVKDLVGHRLATSHDSQICSKGKGHRASRIPRAVRDVAIATEANSHGKVELTTKNPPEEQGS